MYRKDRKGKVGGGIIMYVNTSVEAKRRIDLESKDNESIWFGICPHKSERSLGLLVSGVYHPPSAKNEYNIILEKNIENAYWENKELVILGDFNIDYLNLILNLTQHFKCITHQCLTRVWIVTIADFINLIN